MKTITLAFLTSFLAISHAYSNCEYKLDATSEDLAAYSKDLGLNITMMRFPSQNGSKVGFKLTDLNSDKAFAAMSSKMAKQVISDMKSNTVSTGDHTLPTTGIAAFEFHFKVPNVLKEKGLIHIFPITFGGKLQNNKEAGFYIVYLNNPNDKNKINVFIPIFGSSPDLGSDEISDLKKALPVENTLDGYQRMGFYLNQSTNQIGLIFNNKNYGYMDTLPSKLDNLFFMIPALYSNISTSDQNQDVSIELVTDRNKFKNTYPTGTKDICGN